MNKKIFLSHSQKDKDILKDFIEDVLICGIGFKNDDVFCTSVEGMKIKSGEDWRNAIKGNLLSSKIIILFITPNYKMSEMCLCEMGAAWITENKVLPYIIEPINYETVGVLNEVKQVEKLLEEGSLDRLRDIIKSNFGLETNTDRWNSKKREFVSKANQHLLKNPFPKSITKNEFEKLSDELSSYRKSYDSLVSDKTELEKKYQKVKAAKNKEEVEKIEDEYKDKSAIEDFKDITSKVEIYLNKFTCAIQTLIYNDFTNNKLEINLQYDGSDLNTAKASNYIDDEPKILPDETREMSDLYEALNHLRNFVRELNSDDHEAIVNHFNFYGEINICNLNFWEEQLGACFSIK